MQTQATASTEPDGDLDTAGVIRVLAISGSLREASANSALVRAAAQLAPPGVQVAIFSELEQLPLFNPTWIPNRRRGRSPHSDTRCNRPTRSCSPVLNTHMACPAF
jgi:hypothetical protein